VCADCSLKDFILSILHASPSVRDSKSYLSSFGPQSRNSHQKLKPNINLPDIDPPPLVTANVSPPSIDAVKQQVAEILDPIQRHTALVKIQGPFTDVQLESICRGMVYLEKLGLVSVIVVERDDWKRGEEHERSDGIDEALRIVKALEGQGAHARPVLQAVARLGPKPGDPIDVPTDSLVDPPEAHALPSDLGAIRSALRVGEIPVLVPFALDSFCRTVRIDANYVIAALARGMVEAAQLSSSTPTGPYEFDLTPLRLMIINREGGIPSYARSGLPHLLVNLESEFRHIQDTFQSQWSSSHPSALSNLRLAQACLTYMPKSSSAVVVSHRSPRSLIANLITNKPAQSSSIPHALLSGSKKITPHTPTIIRYGLPIRVVRSIQELSKPKLTALLEQSFGRILDADAFYTRLDASLDCVIIAGDYAGAAIVTNESDPTDPSSPPIAYLDKFSVLPEHQGDGTVDFLWVALHDESYGLGLASALNPNVGGRQGHGTGRDLVWRSRATNPVNKWYFERASGHVRVGSHWAMFWCDAEERIARKETSLREAVELDLVANSTSLMRNGRQWGIQGLSFVEEDEMGRTKRWARIVEAIPSSWVRT
jgi:amino-acid N-acetyltransferase